MGFGQAIKSCFHQYASGTGRARRAEFWLFYLFAQFVQIFGFGAMLVTGLLVLPTSESATSDPEPWQLIVFFVVLGLVVLASLALIVPLYAAWVRRLHDMGQTGHWLWLNLASLGIVPLIMAFMDSQAGPNRWGPDPKAAERGYAGGYGQPQYGQLQYGQAPQGYGPPQGHEPQPGHQPPAAPQ